MNTSGIHPIEFNVLVKPEAVEEKQGSLYKPKESLEREWFEKVRGTLVALSALAFNYDEWPEGSEKPKVGENVIFARHAGVFVDGEDGKEYRVMKDKDILAVIR